MAGDRAWLTGARKMGQGKESRKCDKQCENISHGISDLLILNIGKRAESVDKYT
jgi:hypothetical protein